MELTSKVLNTEESKGLKRFVWEQGAERENFTFHFVPLCTA